MTVSAATSAITGLPATIATAQPAGVKPFKKTLDQSDFLALMSAQLKNQDPTKPMDNTEYVAQMAQFSTVNGIAQSNTTLSAIAAKLDALLAATAADARAATAANTSAATPASSNAATTPTQTPA
jgi:flagellar basal-body rod modification protein FlgD